MGRAIHHRAPDRRNAIKALDGVPLVSRTIVLLHNIGLPGIIPLVGGVIGTDVIGIGSGRGEGCLLRVVTQPKNGHGCGGFMG